VNRTRKLVIPVVLIVLVALGSVLASLGSSPTLGLDLQGGFSVVLQAREVDGQLPSEENVEKAKDIIRQRVDGLGVAEPEITRQGRTVIVQLPGVTDREQAEQVVGCTAKLEFRPVLGVVANPDQMPPIDEALTTVPEGGTTPTSEGEPADDTTTTTEATEGDGEGETGAGAAGISDGEGALGNQFAPTTTTLPPPTTEVPTTEVPTTAPPLDLETPSPPRPPRPPWWARAPPGAPRGSS
jgi:preprotein translocase subunit SecD